MSKILYILIQSIAALLIFVALNNIAVYIMKNEDIIEDPTKLIKQLIIPGWVETKGFTDKAFNTYNRFAKNYKKLPKSSNKFGGAQFTYTLWTKFNNVSAENLAGKVLFLQGDKKKYPYTETIYNKATAKTDYLVKCPLVKFGNNSNELIVEFNTTKDITETAVISRVQSSDETLRHNIFSLTPGKWTMMTFVFQDDKRYGDPENGIIFSFYLNDVLYSTQRFTGALRLNQGDLNILPGSSIQDGYISDLTYHNYALNPNEITKLVSMGYTNKRYDEMQSDPSFNQPLYLSQYNKLEINNL